jgi:hypothetical protein
VAKAADIAGRCAVAIAGFEEILQETHGIGSHGWPCDWDFDMTGLSLAPEFCECRGFRGNLLNSSIAVSFRVVPAVVVGCARAGARRYNLCNR